MEFVIAVVKQICSVWEGTGSADLSFQGELFQSGVLCLTHLETKQLEDPALKGRSCDSFALVIVQQFPLKVEIWHVKWGSQY